MGIAVRNEGSKVNSNINVTPMVDVMLVLLIIFMVITPMLQNKVQIDMAKVDNPDRRCRTPTRKTPSWWPSPATAACSWDRTRSHPSELGSLVRDKLADKTGKTIYVRADARAQYRAVEDAIDAVRTAGVDEVGLLTQKTRRQPRRAASKLAPARCALTILRNETRSLKPWQCQRAAAAAHGRDQCHAR